MATAKSKNKNVMHDINWCYPTYILFYFYSQYLQRLFQEFDANKINPFCSFGLLHFTAYEKQTMIDLFLIQ